MSGMQRYWHNLSVRDQRVLGLGGLIVICILFYALVWSPIQDNLKRLRPLVASQSADLAWMQQQAGKIHKLKQSRPAQKGANALPLLTVVDQTAKSQKIRDRIKQIQPGKESGTAKVWFDKVIFENWLRWMDQISAQGIDVTRVSITKSAEFPRVDIRLELEQK
jgi:general secretion pathway protein M